MTSEAFSLAGKTLKLDTAEDIKPHIAPLVALQNVTSVDFSGNTLGIGACEELGKVLATKKLLVHAGLADIFTSRLLSEIPQALDHLVDALLTLPDLHTIDLSDNAFGLNTVAPIEKLLASHAPLEHLLLNNNGLGPIAGSKVADALTKLAEKKKTSGAQPLRTVVCGRNRLENGSMASWAKAYAAHSTIETIRMLQNGIRQEGIVILLRDGLKHATGLKVFELEDNTFTASGAKALADIIGGWSELQVLNLSDCYLTQRGLEAVGTSLRQKKNVKLELIKLQYNNILPNGIKILADIVQFLPALKRVELNGNKFLDDDVNIEILKEQLNERREAAGEDEDSQEWGIDELDELDSDIEEDEEDDRGDILKEADEAENENVAEEKSTDVDKLADALEKTHV